MTDTVQVSIGAKIDELISEFQKASTSVSASAQKIAEHVGTAMNKVEQSSNEATAAIRRTESESAEASQGMIGSFGKVGSFLSGAFGAIIAGISIREITNEVVEFSDEAERLGNTAQIVGTTATAISRLHNVAVPMGIAAESVDTGMKKLAKSMVEAERGGSEAVQAFEAVGIKAADLKNMSIEQVLGKIADKFHDTEDGAGKTAASMMLLGRSGSDLIPMLNQGSKAMQEQGDAAAAMGAVMGDDAVAAGAALDASLDKLGLQAKGLKNTMAMGLAPALQFISECFTDGDSTAMDFGSVFKGVATIVIGATAVIKAAWEIVSSIVRGVAIAITSIVTAIARAATMDFSGAKAALVQGKEMIVETFTDMNSNLDKLQEKTGKAISGIWDAAAQKPKDIQAPEAKGDLAFGDKSGAGDKSAEAAKKAAEDAKQAAKDAFDYKMQLLQNEMAELEHGNAKKMELAKQETQLVKEQYGEQSAEYARAKGEEAKIAEEVEKEKRRIADNALTTARDHADGMMKLEKAQADYMVATGQINAVQRAQMEQQSEESLYQMQLSYFQQRLQLMATEPQEVERIQQDIERLKMEHATRMQELDTATFQSSKQQWDGYFQAINDGFAGTIQGMIFQGQTWQQGLGNLLQNITSMWLKQMVTTLTSHISTEAAKTGATVTGAAIRTAAEVSSAKTSSAATAGAAIKGIISKGAEVFAGVYNAIAGIPYVGPFLAPVMAIAAGATVLKMVGKVASAEGGWDRVPYDGAQAILHKEEMVLPAPLAEGIRGLVENNQRGGGGVTIHALDRRDVERYFNDNSDVLVRALAGHAANNPGAF